MGSVARLSAPYCNLRVIASVVWVLEICKSQKLFIDSYNLIVVYSYDVAKCSLICAR
jgi:hypothetical protein